MCLSLEARARDVLIDHAVVCTVHIILAVASGAPLVDGGLTPTPTPVAPLGGGETGQAGRAVTPQDVAAYRPAQDPRYDPTEGRAGTSALPTALPSAGNDQINNPLFEEQQQQDISGTAFDQGNDTSPVPFASSRQQEFHSSMYGSSMERQPSSSSFSESSMSSLHPSQQQPSEYGMSASPAFSSHPALGYQQQQTTAPSVAAASIASFYKGPFFPRKSSLPASQQLADDRSAQPAAAEAAEAAALSTPGLSSTPLFGSTPQQPELTADTLALSAETGFDPPGIQSQSSAQQHRPLSIPPPLSVSDESMSASTAVAEPTSAVPLVSPRSTVFDDGPTFAGSPLYSPSENEEHPLVSEDPSFAHQGAPFSSELPREPIFQDNPVFIEVEEPHAVASVSAYHSRPSTDDGFDEQAPEALSSSPVLSSFDMHGQQQQQMVSEFAPIDEPEVLDEPMVYDEAADIPTGPVSMTDSPPLASTPILSSYESSQTMNYTPSAHVAEAVPSYQEPVLPAHSPTLHSNPVFSEDSPLDRQFQAHAPLSRQTSIPLPKPEQDLSYSSTPIFGTQLEQPQLTATSLQSELSVSLAVPEQPSAGELAYSNQPIFGGVQQQPAPAVMQSKPFFALPEQLAAVEPEPEAQSSNQPVFDEPPEHWQQQQQEAYSPPQAAIPLQSEPSLALPEPFTSAQEQRTFSSQPIFGGTQQVEQQQQQLLYVPSQVPADMEVESPAVYNSPRFQSRPIFGSSSAEQAQQAQQAPIQSVSADNPWAYRGAEREPSLALPPDALEVPTQGITFHDNSLFDSAAQPQLPDQGISYFSNSPLAASSQQPAFSPRMPASPLTPANQGVKYFNESPLASSHIGFQQQQSFSSASVPVSVSHVPAPSHPPAPSFNPEPTLGPPAPTDTAQLIPAQPDAAQHAQHSIQFSPTSTFTAPGTPQLQSGGLALYDSPPLGPSSSQSVTPVTTFTAEPTGVLEPVSDPLYDPAVRAATASGAVTCVPTLLPPLDDPLYDPLERGPVVAVPRHPVRPSTLLQPLDDPLYDPTVQRPSQAASVAAAPRAPHGPRFVAAQNSRFPKQQSDPLYDPAAVQSLPGQKDVTHRGEQVGTPTFASQQGPSTFGVPPRRPPQGRTRTRPTPQRNISEDYSSRPILGVGGRRARTVKLTDIGRPPQAPAAPKPFVPLPVQPKAEYEMGGADMLPKDSHYVKPTPYGQLGAHARSALSGAGWKTTWAMEMEDSQQQQQGSTLGTLAFHLAQTG